LKDVDIVVQTNKGLLGCDDVVLTEAQVEGVEEGIEPEDQIEGDTGYQCREYKTPLSTS
jgi:hypothetical protein